NGPPPGTPCCWTGNDARARAARAGAVRPLRVHLEFVGPDLSIRGGGVRRPSEGPQTREVDMSADTQPYPPDAGAQPFLLTVRGTITAPSVADAREIHNSTAGAPPSVAAARSLGDLSHNVYASLGSSREILFIDVWNSLSGLGQFFANPQ